ncbi:hypothetical protein FA15DRAFT_671306 [Coprinopsis marcescibilis]|uniref:F-box domain-containing protein n=1 Tax=Coprinopsis marcescibilis TaxID=230819 RepID=A0A5C3KQF3_COPMA|nr:hypothetical protein FA15DRAFT_671306 [Coprinopsis marcescibilis]
MGASVGLSSLPYDLLLNIANHLDSDDIHTLNLTCRTLHGFSITRPVYRKLAGDLLRRCRALPLKGFQQLTDLTTEQLIRSVEKASHYERAWKTRAPVPIATGPYAGVNSHSNFMDVSEGEPSTISNKWYKVVSAPPDEEVDWLSPITSSYTLCATKKGRVVCWNVQTDKCLAEWNPGEKWELWKCRVEFEERTVYFTMAKVLSGAASDDNRVMEFILMKITFSDGPNGETSKEPPIFSHVTDFKTSGVVMNVFLLDPSSRLLSAFIWVPGSNTIGLYALLDWEEDEYVFIDTGIECVPSSNWSCILYDDHIVIHSEESDIAYQHFYPLSLLRKHVSYFNKNTCIPALSYRLSPARTISKRFTFPRLLNHQVATVEDDGPPTNATGAQPIQSGTIPVNGTHTNAVIPVGVHNGNGVQPTQPAPFPPADPPNPFPYPPWYPESAHFVRQWWPTLPGVPRVSCTVVLLATHDPVSHRTRFVLAQHYFRVPINHKEWFELEEADAQQGTLDPSMPPKAKLSKQMQDALIAQDEALMHMWYVSTPFEVVRVYEGPDDDEEDNGMERPRPLVAVDFGHAAWIEYADPDGDHAASHRAPPDLGLDDEEEQEDLDSDHDQDMTGDDGGENVDGIDEVEDDEIPFEQEFEAKWLRFVTFPSFKDESEYLGRAEAEWKPKPAELEGQVRTLEVPKDLDLGIVETINIDQSQGVVILSDQYGKIYILCYE